MRAIVHDVYGPLNVLQLRDVDRPAPEPGEVLVRVRAAGVDPSIWHLTGGQPYLIRLMGFGLRRPKRRVPGLDLAGVVEEVGPGVTDLRPGDEVSAPPTGRSPSS
jgi:NADPH:quinone reductase-like Zn-dependent oxidoreductase